MASSYYEALPIFRAAMDAAVKIDAAVLQFSRGHKYSLGTKLRDASADILVLVARANRRDERPRWQATLCDRIEELKLLLQLGKEVNAFESFQRFTEVIEQVVGLARQAEAWRRSTSNSRPEPARSVLERRP